MAVLSDDLGKDLLDFLSTGGYKGTSIIHKHLEELGYKINRASLLMTLHSYAEPGGFVSIDGVRQKSWII